MDYETILDALQCSKGLGATVLDDPPDLIGTLYIYAVRGEIPEDKEDWPVMILGSIYSILLSKYKGDYGEWKDLLDHSLSHPEVSPRHRRDIMIDFVAGRVEELKQREEEA